MLIAYVPLQTTVGEEESQLPIGVFSSPEKAEKEKETQKEKGMTSPMGVVPVTLDKPFQGFIK